MSNGQVTRPIAAKGVVKDSTLCELSFGNRVEMRPEREYNTLLAYKSLVRNL